MTTQPPPRGALEAKIEAAIAYSHNFATAKPDIGATEKEHILGLCSLLKEVSALLSAGSEGDKFRELAYVPGAWRCPKCKLRIMASVLSAQDGGMSANNDPQACANGCGPMWRITEREDRQEAQRFAIELSERPAPSAGVGRDEYAELLRLREIVATPPEVWRGWKDLCEANSSIVDEIREIVLPNKQPGNVVEAVRAIATPPASAAREPTGTVADIPDAELLERFVRNVILRGKGRVLAWAAVSKLSGLGSTYSAELCRRFGLDPDTGKPIAAQGGSDG